MEVFDFEQSTYGGDIAKYLFCEEDKMKSFNIRLKKAIANPKVSYTILGILFGLMFPISALIFELTQAGLIFSLESIKYVHNNTPVMFMIDTAPLFLGLFAYFLGASKHKVLMLYDQQNHILTTDPLTGLQNRYACEKKIEEYGKNTAENKCVLSVAIVKIGNLKKINNLVGVSFGNKAVIMIANYLTMQCPENTNVYRISGSEFCVISTDESVFQTIESIATYFKTPVEIENLYCLVKLFIGVAVSSGSCARGEDILNKAYNAASDHKIKQTELYSVYTDEMEPSGDLQMESKIFDAVQNKEFFLVYQPVVDAHTKKVKGSEALLRWNSKDFGVVSPAIFVPFLENTHLIIEVGMRIIKEACCQTKIWQEKFNDEKLFISINVSVSQLFDEDFLSKLIQIVEECRIDKNTIRLEITESVSDEKREFIRDKIMLLGENGFRLSIDDFGTGYSSLAELEQMPLYSLKIDKSFVDRIGQTAKQSHVIESIISMSHKMGICVVMEGVETQEQYDYLSSINCDYIQGYFFSKPLSGEEFEGYILKSDAL